MRSNFIIGADKQTVEHLRYPRCRIRFDAQENIESSDWTGEVIEWIEDPPLNISVLVTLMMEARRALERGIERLP